ncbi:MAG: hypothetical protein II843_01320 [Alphaproteobacteria bacterium]|nr:hypothetical protein [Alphaproteobacteria bacterium]
MKRIGKAMWSAIINLLQIVIKRIQYKGRIEDKLDSVLSNQAEHDKRLLRLEICDAMRRDDRATVHQLYDEYKAMGGNSYMQELYKDYCKKSKKRSKK